LLPRDVITRFDACRLAAIRFIEDIHMKTSHYARALGAALIGLAMLGSAHTALADIKDYEFQLVDPTVKAGPDKIIAVRLVNKATGKSVPDAVIFATRLDMAPDGMQEMATKIAPMPGAEAGTYKFKATFGMAGRWQLSLGAKVQGETGTVESKLVITAQK
jgi:YtkA-like protein